MPPRRREDAPAGLRRPWARARVQGPGDLLAAPRRRRAGARLRHRARQALVVACVVGATAATCSARRAEQAWAPTHEVLVTTRSASPGGALATERRRVPARLHPDDAVAADDDGPLVARRPVGRGQVVVDDDVAPPGQVGLAARVPSGHRAVAVPVAVAPTVAAGHRVDLLAPTVAGSVGGAGVRAVAEDVEVLDRDEDVLTVAVPTRALAAVVGAVAAGPVVAALRGPG